MDPITTLVSAIVAGATTALKPATEQAIKDAYQGLKTIIVNKWKSINLARIEEKPESDNRKSVLLEDLEDAGAQDDPDLISAAEQLLQTIQKHDPDVLLKIGVKLAKLDVKGNVRITDTQGEDRGVDISDSTIGQDLEITGTRQGSANLNPR